MDSMTVIGVLGNITTIILLLLQAFKLYHIKVDPLMWAVAYCHVDDALWLKIHGAIMISLISTWHGFIIHGDPLLAIELITYLFEILYLGMFVMLMIRDVKRYGMHAAVLLAEMVVLAHLNPTYAVYCCGTFIGLFMKIWYYKRHPVDFMEGFIIVLNSLTWMMYGTLTQDNVMILYNFTWGSSILMDIIKKASHQAVQLGWRHHWEAMQRMMHRWGLAPRKRSHQP